MIWLAVLMASAAWMALFYFYVQNAIGFANLGTLLPHEVAVIVLAFVAPPLFLVALVSAFRGQMAVHYKEELIDALPGVMERTAASGTEAIGGAAEALQRHSGELGGLLDRGAANLSETLQKQSSELSGAIERNATQVADSMNRQVAELTRALDAKGGEIGADLQRQSAQLAETLERQTSRFGEAVAKTEQRIDILVQRLVRQQNELEKFDSLVQKLGKEREAFDQTITPGLREIGDIKEKTEGLRQLIEQMVNVSRMTLSGLSEATSGLSGALDKAVGEARQQIDSTVGRVDSLLKQHADSLDRNGEEASARMRAALDAVGIRLRDQVDVVSKSIGEELAKISGAAKLASEQAARTVAAGGEIFAKQAQAFNAGIAGTIGKIGELSGSFDAQLAKLHDASSVVADRGTQLSEAFSRQTAALASAATRAEAASAGINEQIERQVRMLERTIIESGKRLDGAEERLRKRLADLTGAADQAGGKIGTTGEALRKEAMSLAALTSKAFDQFGQMHKALIGYADDVGKRVEQLQTHLSGAVGEVGKLDQQMHQQGEEITKLAQSVSANIGKLNSQLGEHTRTLVDAVDTALDRGTALGDALHEQATTLQRNIENLSDRAPALGALLQQQTQTIMDQSGMAIEKLNEVGDLFTLQHDAMEQTWRSALSGLQELSAIVAREVNALHVASDDAAERLTEVGDVFAARAKQIGEASRGALGEAEQTSKAIGTRTEEAHAAMCKLVQETEAIATQMKEQTEAMAQAASQASETVAKVRESELEVRRDSFLQSASEVMSQLNAAAIDMNRLLAGGIPAEHWARYQAGDRGFFTRRLLKIKDDGALATVRERYENDGQFRAHVDRFLRQFEKLEERAREIDTDKLLHHALITADVGKVYILLIEALGRRH